MTKFDLLFFFQSDDSDIWDDTALIKAYDKAVASFKVQWVLFTCRFSLPLIACHVADAALFDRLL